MVHENGGNLTGGGLPAGPTVPDFTTSAWSGPGIARTVRYPQLNDGYLIKKKSKVLGLDSIT
jgi:hypothetical protein